MTDQKTATPVVDTIRKPAVRTSSPFDVAEVRKRVETALHVFLDRRAPELRTVGGDVAAAGDLVRGFLAAGGKRIRPVLCYWGWRAAGGRDTGSDHEGIIAAAASLELFHAFGLVHDDIMDDSRIRRGQPTVHRRMAALHARCGWHGDPDLFGTGAGILVGDLCLVWSLAMFRECGLPVQAIHSASRLLHEMHWEVMGGQYLDLVGQCRRDRSVADAATVVRYKSAKYTVERPLQVGAALAGADTALLQAFTRFGVPLGEAFQLRDDVLGVFGDPALTGKSNTDDLREGKATVMVALARTAASPPQHRRMDELLGNHDLDPDGAQELRHIITTTGALARVEEMITERAARALRELDRSPASAEARAALRDLAGALTVRTS
ncbi:polyprenyl synthetase family protein [Actinomycetes bacterium KLBMP 9759]